MKCCSMVWRTWASSCSLAFSGVMLIAVSILRGVQWLSRMSVLFAVRNRVKLRPRRDIKDAVGDDRRCVDAYVKRWDQILIFPTRRLQLAVDVVFACFAVFKNHDSTAVRADVNLAVDIIRRAPNSGLEVVLPVALAGLRIQAVQISRFFGDVNQAVVDRSRAER